MTVLVRASHKAILSNGEGECVSEETSFLEASSEVEILISIDQVFALKHLLHEIKQWN